MMVEKHWRKSTRSQNTTTCVEVSSSLDEVRDSKDPDGPTLRLNGAAFAAFVRAGRFDRCGQRAQLPW